MAEDLSVLNVAELKERLREAGLPVSGKKDELIARLEETASPTSVEASEAEAGEAVAVADDP